MSGRYLVTGATGFVGTELINNLLCEPVQVAATILSGEDSSRIPSAVGRIVVEPSFTSCDYADIMLSTDIVVHLAARAHITKETAQDPLGEFRKINLSNTEHIARLAANSGVKRFIFMSTVGVNGNTTNKKPFSEDDAPNPQSPYARSKYEAELVLQQIASESGMEVVIIRAPLVYGPGNPGNFLSLLRIVSKGLPLPLASVNNQRSFIFVRNLTDAIIRCAVHPAAAGKIYLVSDGEDISTPDLIRRTGSSLKVPVRLLPFPKILMQIAGILTGKTALIDRLVGSLVIDSSRIRADLDWKPTFTLEEGLQLTASWFLGLQGRSDEADI